MERLAQLRAVLQGREPVLIASHYHPDADSLAASAAFKALVERAFGLEATIAYDGFVGRAENRLLLKFLGATMEPMDRVSFEDFPAVAVVDTQPGQGNNPVPPDLPVLIVIDHHPPVVKPTEVVFWDVRDTYGATSTILTEYLLQAEVEIDRALATGLFYGISSETQTLGSEAVQADVDAAMALYPLIDKRMLSQIEHAPIRPEYMRDLVVSLSRAVRYGPLAVSLAGDIEHPELVAEVADWMLRLEGIKWSLAMGRLGDTLYVSLRTWPLEDEDASDLIRRVVKELGRAGGHGHRAGGQVNLAGLPPEGVEAVLRAVVRNLRELRPGADVPPEPLLPEKNLEDSGSF